MKAIHKYGLVGLSAMALGLAFFTLLFSKFSPRPIAFLHSKSGHEFTLYNNAQGDLWLSPKDRPDKMLTFKNDYYHDLRFRKSCWRNTIELEMVADSGLILICNIETTQMIVEDFGQQEPYSEIPDTPAIVQIQDCR